VAADELATPLYDVTFVVVDLETTGGSARGGDAITEIGALKLRGGELLGTLDTLVNPGVPIPPEITMITGITDDMLWPAPAINEILPAWLEFASDAVIVGHNIRFDCSFLDAALAAHEYPRMPNRRIDTVALARRLVRDETQNMKLGTLAHYFRTDIEPVHRAYADATATAELFHTLLERAASYAADALDDLLALPKMRPHPTSDKLRLTALLPRAPGVFVFRDRASTPIYVDRAQNLRSRVRSHFTANGKRVVPQMLKDLAAIDHHVCAADETDTLAQALVDEYQPRYNRKPLRRPQRERPPRKRAIA
jgi:DNA polymerase-3 subunit epsilon